VLNILFAFLILTCLSPTNAFSRGDEVDEEEYDKWPGENVIEKIRDDFVVPNLVGENILASDFKERTVLRLKHFKIKQIQSKPDKSPKGTILTQFPGPNALVKTRELIKVIVSSGPFSK
jgi:hypothetical protein